jgi:hypothetical protein
MFEEQGALGNHTQFAYALDLSASDRCKLIFSAQRVSVPVRSVGIRWKREPGIVTQDKSATIGCGHDCGRRRIWCKLIFSVQRGSANLASSLKINPQRSGVAMTAVVGGFGGSANLASSLKINPRQSGVVMTVVVGGFGAN